MAVRVVILCCCSQLFSGALLSAGAPGAVVYLSYSDAQPILESMHEVLPPMLQGGGRIVGTHGWFAAIRTFVVAWSWGTKIPWSTCCFSVPPSQSGSESIWPHSWTPIPQRHCRLSLPQARRFGRGSRTSWQRRQVSRETNGFCLLSAFSDPRAFLPSLRPDNICWIRPLVSSMSKSASG